MSSQPHVSFSNEQPTNPKLVSFAARKRFFHLFKNLIRTATRNCSYYTVCEIKIISTLTNPWCETDVINGNKSFIVSLCFDQQLSAMLSVNVIDQPVLFSIILSYSKHYGTWKGVTVSMDWESLVQLCPLLLRWNTRSSCDGPERMYTRNVPESLTNNRQITCFSLIHTNCFS